MPVPIPGPDTRLVIHPERLSNLSFSLFGTVVENPEPLLIPSLSLNSDNLPLNSVQANQGTALKFLDVTHMRNLYRDAPSNVQGEAVMNMFVCAPRRLIKSEGALPSALSHFVVEILERHPYTTQTFIPLGLSKLHAHEARYLVIVAPSLPPTSADELLPVPRSRMDNGKQLPGRGLPDLKGIRAFIADGSQAVTYGAGTWHAPMVVIGTKAIDFVVVQFANGVGVEDCQEASLEGKKEAMLMVAVPEVAPLTSKL